MLPAAQAGFVNAVLRELGRRGVAPLPPESDPVAYLGVRHSFPDWLVRRWLERFGRAAAEAMFQAANEAPPLVARVNRLRATRAQAAGRLAEQGLAAEPGATPYALILDADGDPARLPGFAEGWLYYQDEAAQMIGYLAAPPAEGLSLDWCSAPGGKTTHLAELAGDHGRVWAYDQNRAKLRRVAQNARRLGLTSISLPVEPPPRSQADRVLVDAPCSGLGTLRRHAEARWRVTEPDLVRLAGIQLGLLEQAADSVRPGGDLIYATCTTEPEENEGVVTAFLAKRPDFRLQPGPGADGQPPAAAWGPDGMFRSFPGRPEWDGVFAARLRLAG